MRDTVRRLIKLGRIPINSDEDEYWALFRSALLEIEAPLNQEEAEALLVLFWPEDEEDGAGMAWTLVHLVETADLPLAVLKARLAEGDWLNLLYDRKMRSVGVDDIK